MDIRKIKKLIELLEQTDLTEIEIHEENESVRISRFSSQISHQAVETKTIHQASPVLTPPSIHAPEQTGPQVTESAAQAKTPGHTVKSPMVGTAYLAASPGTKPFVEIGQIVKEGDILCIVEAMKMFNEIEADKSGKITAVYIENGQPVEYNQQLFTIE